MNSRALFNLKCDHCNNMIPCENVLVSKRLSSLEDTVSVVCPHCGNKTDIIEIGSDDDVLYAVSSIPCVDYLTTNDPLRLLFRSHEEAIDEMNRRIDSVFDAYRLVKITSEDDENRIVLADAVTTELAFIATIEVIPKSDFIRDNVNFDFLRNGN